MSEAVKLDEGVSYEIQAANMFAEMGRFTRCHLQVFPIQANEEVGDIDVLALQFDRHLFPKLTIVEAKKQSNRFSDIFKLYGFKNYFGNCDAYFLSADVHGPVSETAKKLGIVPLQFGKFKQILEKDSKIAFEPWSIHYLRNTIGYLRLIRDSVDKDLFLEFHYLWLERNPYERFYRYHWLFEKSRKPAQKNAPAERALGWYRKELFVLAFVAMLEIASDCVDLRLDGVHEYIEGKFANAGIRKDSKLKIKRGVDKLLDVIRKTSTAEIKAPELDIIPAYTSELVELVQMALKGASFAQTHLLTNDNLHRRLELDSRAKGNIREFTGKENYFFLRALNERLLKILHSGPIQSDFDSFV